MTDAIDSEMELVTLSYPDPLIRPVPPFSIDIPPGWAVSEFPDSLFVVGPPPDLVEHWSNIIVRHERFFPSTTLEEIAKATWNSLRVDYPYAVVKDERLIRLAETHYIREAEITMEGEPGPVTRFDSFTFGPVVDHPTVDLFQITWLHPAVAGSARVQLYLQMLATFRFQR